MAKITSEEFIKVAISTESKKDMVPILRSSLFDSTIHAVKELSEVVDIYKKGTFYNEYKYNESEILEFKNTFKINEINNHLRIASNTLMDANTKESVPYMRGTGYKKIEGQDNTRIYHAILGLFTESGELFEVLNDIVDGKQIDKTNLIEECGDILWYLAVIFDVLNVEFEDAMEVVANKLKVRYGLKFNADSANKRKLDEERKTMDTDIQKINNKKKQAKRTNQHKNRGKKR